mgnify:CR=1 FL=1
MSLKWKSNETNKGLQNKIELIGYKLNDFIKESLQDREQEENLMVTLVMLS